MIPVIDIRANLRAVSRDLDDLARRQLPFASVLAINDVANQVKAAETQALDQVFNDPVPFTERAFRVKSARKSDPEAKIFAMPVQAEYLAPSEDDDPQFLGKGARIRTPVNIALSAGGNIAKSKMRTMLARKDVFIGHVRGIGGVWQRLPSKGKGRKGATDGQRLRLLVAFTKPVHIATRLEYHERAEKVINAGFPAAFERAMARALASRR